MGQHVTRIVQVLLRPLARFLAKRASKIQAGLGRIDTHIHALPPAYLAELSKVGVSYDYARFLLERAIFDWEPGSTDDVVMAFSQNRAIRLGFPHQNGRLSPVSSR